ncbi:MAG: hypothetical protein ACMUIP_02905 [bacterium]
MCRIKKSINVLFIMVTAFSFIMLSITMAQAQFDVFRQWVPAAKTQEMNILGADWIPGTRMPATVPAPEKLVETKIFETEVPDEDSQLVETTLENDLADSNELIVAAVGPMYQPNLISGGNKWIITFFDDSSPTHTQWATQGICFRYTGRAGRHDRYVWWSDTFPDWNGRATQEGDQIIMYGDYARDVGHDGMIWDIVTSSRSNEGAGHWWEWREDGKYGRVIGFGNAKLIRRGKCECDEDKAMDIDLPLTKDGYIMETPAGVQFE